MSFPLDPSADPNFVSHRCMKCQRGEPRRFVSTFANELRTFLCWHCHVELEQLVGQYLHAQDADSLTTHCERADGKGCCSQCQALELYRNVSVLAVSSDYRRVVSIPLCHPCQCVLTEQVRAWLSPRGPA